MKVLRQLYAWTAAMKGQRVSFCVLAVGGVLLAAMVVTLRPPRPAQGDPMVDSLLLMHLGKQTIANTLLTNIQDTLVQISQQLERHRHSSGTPPVPLPGAPVVSPILPARDAERCRTVEEYL
jgi:hypothetical protein